MRNLSILLLASFLSAAGMAQTDVGTEDNSTSPPVDPSAQESAGENQGAGTEALGGSEELLAQIQEASRLFALTNTPIPGWDQHQVFSASANRTPPPPAFWAQAPDGSFVAKDTIFEATLAADLYVTVEGVRPEKSRFSIDFLGLTLYSLGICHGK